MNERHDMTCGEFADVAAELALGVLTGRERAAAVAHMEQCDDCRETVRKLAAAGEELVGLLPCVEPPAGFETRVLARIGIPPVPQFAPVPEPVPVLEPLPDPHPIAAQRGGEAPRRRVLTRRVLAIAAAWVAIAAAGLGGWGLRGLTSPVAGSPSSAQGEAGESLEDAPLLSASHRTLGEVYYHTGESRWMYMTVNLAPDLGTVTCQLQTADGHYRTVGSFWLASGYGSWAGPDRGPRDPVTGARIVDASGKVLATARF